MSDIGLILILAVLVSGGLIATVGDRLGSRVGKARLSLFNLRPKKTATVVTILTGTLISASTLGILLLASRQFREMLLNFGQLQTDLKTKNRELRKTLEDLSTTVEQKKQVQQELTQARSQRTQVEQQLGRINQSLQVSRKRQAETNTQLKRSEQQRDAIRAQLNAVSQQATVLRSDISRLSSERQALITQRDQVKAQIAARDQEIAQRTKIIQQRDQDIAQRDRQLKQLEVEQARLAEAVQQSEQEAEQIRSGSLAILRNQVLSSGLVRITDPKGSKQAVDQVLREANRVALQLIQPGSPEDVQVVQIQTSEVQRLINQVDDGRDYAVRIIAAANYVRGERKLVAVYANAALNQILFLSGDVIAAKSVNPSQMSPQDFDQSIEQLVAFSSFRARRAGVLNEVVQIENLQSLPTFLAELRRQQTPVEIRAVVADSTYTVGPLRIELVAVQNGQVILRTARRE